VLSVRETHTVAPAAGLGEDLRTANLSIEMRCVDVAKLRGCGSRSISVKGAGFSDADAVQGGLRNAAPEVERFVKSLGI
jgi:hypothetical protein